MVCVDEDLDPVKNEMLEAIGASKDEISSNNPWTDNSQAISDFSIT